jgi:hypothetical protein
MRHLFYCHACLDILCARLNPGAVRDRRPPNRVADSNRDGDADPIANGDHHPNAQPIADR